MMKRILFISCMFISCSQILFSQNTSRELGIPYMRNYTPKDYDAFAQNWAIVQDKRGVMYFGNGNGVLEYDGVSWRLIRLAQESVAASAEKYTYVPCRRIRCTSSRRTNCTNACFVSTPSCSWSCCALQPNSERSTKAFSVCSRFPKRENRTVSYSHRPSAPNRGIARRV